MNFSRREVILFNFYRLSIAPELIIIKLAKINILKKMKKILLSSVGLIAVVLMMASCNQAAQKKVAVKKDNFGVYEGKDVFLFTLTNKDGNILKLTNFGARIVWIEVPDRNGKKDNVTFGFDT